jgi:hypothetical protein
VDVIWSRTVIVGAMRVADDGDGLDSGGAGAEEAPRPTEATRFRLTTNERLTVLVGVGSLLVALGSLAVSFLTYEAAKDTTEIKGAISQIAKLADQTKRQADATSGQLDQIKRQADSSVIIANAAKDSASAAQAQTKAIAQQTEAIKATSDASIRAAKAQQNMAEVTAKSQVPVPDLFELSITNLSNPPDDKGYVKASLMWRFRNVGGSAFVVKNVEFGVSFGEALPDKMPADRFAISGAGISVLNNITSSFGPSQSLDMMISKDYAQAVVSKKSKIFFYAVMNYIDQMGAAHTRCFGREFKMNSTNTGNSEFYFPTGGKAYSCQT